MYLEPEKGTCFGRSLPLLAIKLIKRQFSQCLITTNTFFRRGTSESLGIFQLEPATEVWIS